MHEDYGYFLGRVRRYIPAPADLLWRLEQVEALYLNLVDAKTQEPLFRNAAVKEWKQLKKHVSKGCLSDHPSIPLYFEVPRKDSCELCCVRDSDWWSLFFS